MVAKFILLILMQLFFKPLLIRLDLWDAAPSLVHLLSEESLLLLFELGCRLFELLVVEANLGFSIFKVLDQQIIFIVYRIFVIL